MNIRNWSQIIPLESFPIPKIWGGDAIAKRKGLDKIAQQIGEFWELSTLPDSNDVTFPKELKYDEFDESDLYGPGHIKEKWPKGPHFVIKFIEARKNLSIQVHPKFELHKLLEPTLNVGGKDECWVILDTLGTESGVYLGLRNGVLRQDLERAIQRKEDVSQYLNFVNVQKGDFIFVPGGLCHAIGEGIILAEIQTPRGVTNRLWDWNRRDSQGNSRELHIQEGLNSINFNSDFNSIPFKNRVRGILGSKSFPSIFKHQVFNLAKFVVTKENHIVKSLQNNKGGECIICLEGNLRIKRGDEQIIIAEFKSAFLPFKGEDDVVFETDSFSQFLVVH